MSAQWRSADYVIAKHVELRCSSLTLTIIEMLYEAARDARLAMIADSARRVRRQRAQRQQSLAR